MREVKEVQAFIQVVFPGSNRISAQADTFSSARAPLVQRQRRP